MNDYTDYLVLLKKHYDSLLNTTVGSRGYVITFSSKGSRKGIATIETAQNQKTFIGDGHTEQDHEVIAAATVLKPQGIGIIPYHHPNLYQASLEQLKELRQIKLMVGIDDLLIVGEDELGIINSRTNKESKPKSSKIAIANTPSLRKIIETKEQHFLSRLSA